MHNSISTLNNNDVHIWLIEPEKIDDINLLTHLESLLCPSEIEKVNRYRSPKAQHSALITRSFLRLVLSQYASIKPQEWLFKTQEKGKPELINSPIPLNFNLSHNDNLIVCAVTLDNNIGCDIENLSRKINIESIAKRYFSKLEFNALTGLSKPLQQRRFFEYWTLKEALVKTTGLGISQGLESFSFAIGETTHQKYNDNIKLSFLQPENAVNSGDWYNALLYPDKHHCIALCINNKHTSNNNYNIQLFDGMQSLKEFNTAL